MNHWVSEWLKDGEVVSIEAANHIA